MTADGLASGSRLTAMAASLIAHIGRHDFQSEMTRSLHQCLAVDAGLILLYRKDEVPQVLYNDWVTAQGRKDIRRYLSGPYRLDPFYQLAADNPRDGLYRLNRIASGRFDRSAYYRDYYHQSGLGDEFNFIFSLDRRAKLAISLSRNRAAQRFSPDEEDLLSAAAPLLQSAVLRHWRDLRPATDEPEAARLGRALSEALARFGTSLLTPRECEVAQFILRGHSLKSAARELAISPATVKLHRRNLYSKLGITSQTELFALFIAAVSAAGDAHADPLEAILPRAVSA